MLHRHPCRHSLQPHRIWCHPLLPIGVFWRLQNDQKCCLWRFLGPILVARRFAWRTKWWASCFSVEWQLACKHYQFVVIMVSFDCWITLKRFIYFSINPWLVASYSATLSGSRWSDLVCAAGTVYNKVLIWNVADSETGGRAAYRHVLAGHEVSEWVSATHWNRIGMTVVTRLLRLGLSVESTV